MKMFEAKQLFVLINRRRTSGFFSRFGLKAIDTEVLLTQIKNVAIGMGFLSGRATNMSMTNRKQISVPFERTIARAYWR
jgi:hypothetical protein